MAGTTGLERALIRRLLHRDRLAGGQLLARALTEGEGMVVADLDFRLIQKRKGMMDSVGH